MLMLMVILVQSNHLVRCNHGVLLFPCLVQTVLLGLPLALPLTLVLALALALVLCVHLHPALF